MVNAREFKAFLALKQGFEMPSAVSNSDLGILVHALFQNLRILAKAVVFASSEVRYSGGSEE